MNTPLRQFAQAYVRGYELHRIEKSWRVFRRNDKQEIIYNKPFPGCEGDLPKETRRLFIEVHTDGVSGRVAI